MGVVLFVGFCECGVWVCCLRGCFFGSFCCSGFLCLLWCLVFVGVVFCYGWLGLGWLYFGLFMLFCVWRGSLLLVCGGVCFLVLGVCIFIGWCLVLGIWGVGLVYLVGFCGVGWGFLSVRDFLGLFL